MPRVAIVTGADDKYFPLLWSLVRSLKYFSTTRDIDCFVIDGGLNDGHLETLTDAGAFPKTVDWGFGFDHLDGVSGLPRHLQCLTSLLQKSRTAGFSGRSREAAFKLGLDQGRKPDRFGQR
jgi:hypothetical protein